MESNCGQDCKSDEHEQVWEFVRNATMTSRERVVALCDAVNYVANAGIGGDIVECGVWKGGSMMAAAKTLIQNNNTDRKLWLYDTFSGMNPPSDRDVDYHGNSATSLLEHSDPQQADSIWCCAGLDQVKQNVQSTGYPSNNVHYVVGEVESTLVGATVGDEEKLPKQIAILRLDTDWYESTRIALEQLYPRLQPGGVLIIDDYGHWKGCREAVDEYFSDAGNKPFLNRIDYTGRIAIKCTLPREQVADYET